MKVKAKAKAKPETASRGRPKKFQLQLNAYASVGAAIAAMARSGADWHNALAGLKHAPKRKVQRGQSEWWGAEKLAQLLDLGNKDVFNRMALGRTPISPEKAVSCMRELIKEGLLDPQELRTIPRTLGHARALLPFRPVWPELRKARYFQVPSPELAQQVDHLAESYRSAIATRADAEGEERMAVRSARADAVRALLDLQPGLARSPLSTDRDVIQAVVDTIEKLNETMTRVVHGVCEVALSPREVNARFARQFMAPSGPDGQPDFAGLFRAVTIGAPHAAEEPSAVIDHFVQRVTDRWGVDSRLSGWRQAVPNFRVLDLVVPDPKMQRPKRAVVSVRRPRRPLSVRSGRRRAKAGFKYARNAGAPVRAFATRYSELTPRDLKFMRRITRPSGCRDPRLLLTMAMAEEWFFGDERPDCRQTDFEGRLDEVREWARSVLAHPMASEAEDMSLLCGGGTTFKRPSTANLKRLIRELMRLDVRPMVELSLDMPELAPQEGASPAPVPENRISAKAARAGAPTARSVQSLTGTR